LKQTNPNQSKMKMETNKNRDIKRNKERTGTNA
jgi:hypothetical protein